MPELDLPGWSVWLLAAGAIALAAWNIGRLATALRIDRLMVRMLAAAMQPATDRLDAHIREVLAEVRPNGGASLRDAVDRTHRLLEGHITESSADREDLRSQLTEARAKLDEMAARADDHVAYAERNRPEPGDTYDDPHDEQP